MAQSPKTTEELQEEINQYLADNTTGAITAAILRRTLIDIIWSYSNVESQAQNYQKLNAITLGTKNGDVMAWDVSESIYRVISAGNDPCVLGVFQANAQAQYLPTSQLAQYIDFTTLKNEIYNSISANILTYLNPAATLTHLNGGNTTNTNILKFLNGDADPDTTYNKILTYLNGDGSVANKTNLILKFLTDQVIYDFIKGLVRSDISTEYINATALTGPVTDIVDAAFVANLLNFTRTTNPNMINVSNEVIASLNWNDLNALLNYATITSNLPQGALLAQVNDDETHQDKLALFRYIGANDILDYLGLGNLNPENLLTAGYAIGNAAKIDPYATLGAYNASNLRNKYKNSIVGAYLQPSSETTCKFHKIIWKSEDGTTEVLLKNHLLYLNNTNIIATTADPSTTYSTAIATIAQKQFHRWGRIDEFGYLYTDTNTVNTTVDAYDHVLYYKAHHGTQVELTYENGILTANDGTNKYHYIEQCTVPVYQLFDLNAVKYYPDDIDPDVTTYTFAASPIITVAKGFVGCMRGSKDLLDTIKLFPQVAIGFPFDLTDTEYYGIDTTSGTSQTDNKGFDNTATDYFVWYTKYDEDDLFTGGYVKTDMFASAQLDIDISEFNDLGGIFLSSGTMTKAHSASPYNKTIKIRNTTVTTDEFDLGAEIIDPHQAVSAGYIADALATKQMINQAITSSLHLPVKLSLESDLPATGADGDYYVIENMDVTAPGQQGRAWWNSTVSTSAWQKIIDQEKAIDATSIILDNNSQLSVSQNWVVSTFLLDSDPTSGMDLTKVGVTARYALQALADVLPTYSSTTGDKFLHVASDGTLEWKNVPVKIDPNTNNMIATVNGADYILVAANGKIPTSMFYTIINDTQVLTTDWQASSDPNFPYLCRISIAAATATMVPEVTFNTTDMLSGKLSPIAETGAGYVDIWATEPMAITIPVIKLLGA